MSKRKKTRQQKVIADLRRQLIQTTSNGSTTPSIKLNGNNPDTTTTKGLYSLNVSVPQQGNTIIVRAEYLKHDLLKTCMVTAAIVACELILFFGLKQHIFSLTGLQY